MQKKLFEIQAENKKTYRAIRHDVTRKKQNDYSDSLHHPKQKINQIKNVLSEFCGWADLSTLELFAGQGNCTKIYAEFGEVIANEQKNKVFKKLIENVKNCAFVHCNKVDSFLDFHQLIALKQKFDVVDLDPYGFPNRFFPDVFLLIDKGVLFVTMPKPFVNILNGITQTHLISYYGEQNPSLETIIEKIATWGVCHWRKVELINYIDLKSVWRFAFKVEKVKATEYCNVKNK
tara:strand:- start:129 stop:827 length:699 start_codon:yes stop_codon:yes gene_type:complete